MSLGWRSRPWKPIPTLPRQLSFFAGLLNPRTLRFSLLIRLAAIRSLALAAMKIRDSLQRTDLRRLVNSVYPIQQLSRYLKRKRRLDPAISTTVGPDLSIDGISLCSTHPHRYIRFVIHSPPDPYPTGPRLALLASKPALSPRVHTHTHTQKERD